MFTGLIEAVGRITEVSVHDGGWRLRLHAPFAADVAEGESVAVNGVCLTMAGIDGGVMSADIGPETARITTLGSLRPADPVNLERAIRAGDRFGGHFVQGHVDAVGVVDAVRHDGEAHWLTIAYPPELGRYFVGKGSVAVDGISLTVAALAADRFDVMIVPFTWAHTNLPSLGAGSRVNLECDMVGKYVARALELRT